MMTLARRVALTFLCAAVLSGCAATSLVYHSTDAQSPPVEPALVILPPNVEVSLLTAALASLGGVSLESLSMQFRSALVDLGYGHVKGANFDDAALQDVGGLLQASQKRWEKAIGHLLRDFPL